MLIMCYEGCLAASHTGTKPCTSDAEMCDKAVSVFDDLRLEWTDFGRQSGAVEVTVVAT